MVVDIAQIFILVGNFILDLVSARRRPGCDAGGIVIGLSSSKKVGAFGLLLWRKPAVEIRQSMILR